ncbi:MAG: ATP-binding cassette domain-containing protein [Proteobacteria bacterium]|nr:ATP-binding cassette domain-containing protein [Pseudomonadota bacterium]
MKQDVKRPAIALEDVCVTLPSRAGDVEILRGVDLTIKQDEAVAISGPSGSGKTTLLMVTAGLERATSGRVEISGQPLAGLSEDALAKMRAGSIGIVFQSFHLVPTMTALENTALPLEFLDAPNPFTAARKALADVGLSDRADHFPAQLSGGEQQRVALARALSTGPKIILADEPTGNLDSKTGGQVMDLLFDLRARHGATLMLITHDEKLAKRCSRVLHMNDGRFVQTTQKRKKARA